MRAFRVPTVLVLAVLFFGAETAAPTTAMGGGSLPGDGASRPLSAYERALMNRAVSGLDHHAMHRRAEAESRARARH